MNKITEYIENPNPEGERNASLYRAAAFCNNDGIPEATAIADLLPRAVSDGLPEAEAKATIKSAYRTQPRPSLYRHEATPMRQRRTIPPPPAERKQALIDYLDAVFQAGDLVNTVTQSKAGKPAGRGHDIEQGAAIKALQAGRTITDLFGKPTEDAGAWIRINPVDGNGVADSNITAYRNLLVECDDLPIDEQLSTIERLQLPYRALVHSAGKSIHAVVAIDACNLDEYRERQQVVYAICRAGGLPIDTANKNPSRLSRLPSISRAGQQQYMIAANKTPQSWHAWHSMALAASLGIIQLQSIHIPDVQLRPELIRSLLRAGHIMMLSGPSKAGKSFLLIALAIAVAYGLQWLGWQCNRGRVLYVNLEIDDPSMLHRFQNVADAMSVDLADAAIDVVNLRGQSITADSLTERLTHLPYEYSLIIVDPYYKLLAGDENAAGDITAFCILLDRIATESGASIVYCHHHSKGQQGGKSSIDRASGSGVFSRHADAIIDLCPQRDLFVVDATVREFKSPEPRYYRFDWPIHVEVEDLEAIASARSASDPTAALRDAITRCGGFGKAGKVEVASILDRDVRTVERHMKTAGYVWRDGAIHES